MQKLGKERKFLAVFAISVIAMLVVPVASSAICCNVLQPKINGMEGTKTLTTTEKIEKTIESKSNYYDYDITIKGGFGVTITIICNEDMNDDWSWDVDIDGLTILILNMPPRKTNLPNGQVKIVEKIPVLAFGSIDVRVLNDESVVEEAKGIVIGGFVFL